MNKDKMEHYEVENQMQLADVFSKEMQVAAEAPQDAREAPQDAAEVIVGEQQDTKEPQDIGDVEDVEIISVADPNIKQKTGKAFQGAIQVKDAAEARRVADEIKTKFQGAKIVGQYAVAIHDKDVYTQADVEKAKRIRDNPQNPKPDYQIPEAGKPKPVHVHWAFKVPSTKGVKPDRVAELLNQPLNQVNYCKTRKGDKVSGFYRMCEYFTHSSQKQQALGKTLYPDNVVETDASTDWRKELSKIKGNAELDDKIRQMCMDGTINKTELQKEYPDLWKKHGRDYKFLLDNRKDPETPKYLINILISGHGDLGKSVFAEYIAERLYPDLPLNKRRLLIKDACNPYQNYDGQPVAIWDEARPRKILKSQRLGREAFFNMINPRQAAGTGYDIKYGSRVVAIEYNIFTNPAEYPSGKFMSELCGEVEETYYDAGVKAEGIEQAWRRFQLCIDMFDDHWEIWTCNNWKPSEVAKNVERVRLPDIKTPMHNENHMTVGNIRRACTNNDELFRAYVDPIYGDIIIGYLQEIKEASSFQLGADDIEKMFGKPPVSNKKEEAVAAAPDDDTENDIVDDDIDDYITDGFETEDIPDEYFDYEVLPMTDDEIKEWNAFVDALESPPRRLRGPVSAAKRNGLYEVKV